MKAPLCDQGPPPPVHRVADAVFVVRGDQRHAVRLRENLPMQRDIVCAEKRRLLQRTDPSLVRWTIPTPMKRWMTVPPTKHDLSAATQVQRRLHGSPRRGCKR